MTVVIIKKSNMNYLLILCSLGCHPCRVTR